MLPELIGEDKATYMLRSRGCDTITVMANQNSNAPNVKKQENTPAQISMSPAINAVTSNSSSATNIVPTSNTTSTNTKSPAPVSTVPMDAQADNLTIIIVGSLFVVGLYIAMFIYCYKKVKKRKNETSVDTIKYRDCGKQIREEDDDSEFDYGQSQHNSINGREMDSLYSYGPPRESINDFECSQNPSNGYTVDTVHSYGPPRESLNDSEYSYGSQRELNNSSVDTYKRESYTNSNLSSTRDSKKIKTGRQSKHQSEYYSVGTAFDNEQASSTYYEESKQHTNNAKTSTINSSFTRNPFIASRIQSVSFSEISAEMGSVGSMTTTDFNSKILTRDSLADYDLSEFESEIKEDEKRFNDNYV